MLQARTMKKLVGADEKGEEGGEGSSPPQARTSKEEEEERRVAAREEVEKRENSFKKELLEGGALLSGAALQFLTPHEQWALRQRIDRELELMSVRQLCCWATVGLSHCGPLAAHGSPMARTLVAPLDAPLRLRTRRAARHSPRARPLLHIAASARCS